MKEEQAIGIGQDALIFLAGRPELLDACLAASGLASSDLRARAGEPDFLGFVLDFLLESDDRVTAFAAEAGLRPEAVARARVALGGAAPEWT